MTENTTPPPVKRRRFRSRATFLARSEDIKSLLDNGLGLSHIHVELGLDCQDAELATIMGAARIWIASAASVPQVDMRACP